jgi:2,4-dichlorophenol 6-monooxygenase
MPDRGEDQAMVETEVLIIGAGPAGGSLAAFLAHQGISCLAISKYGSTANTPRAVRDSYEGVILELRADMFSNCVAFDKRACHGMFSKYWAGAENHTYDDSE